MALASSWPFFQSHRRTRPSPPVVNNVFPSALNRQSYMAPRCPKDAVRFAGHAGRASHLAGRARVVGAGPTPGSRPR